MGYNLYVIIIVLKYKLGTLKIDSQVDSDNEFKFVINNDAKVLIERRWKNKTIFIKGYSVSILDWFTNILFLCFFYYLYKKDGKL